MLTPLSHHSTGLSALALAFASACGGGDPVAVSVEMALDPTTCTAVPDPGAVQLACEAAAGVWLRGGPSADVLDGGCVDFRGQSPTLADLPELLASTELTTTSSESISVDVAVYAPWQSASDCPTPDVFARDHGDRDIVVWGSSAVVDLSESSTRLAVELHCGAIEPVEPGEPVDPSGDGGGEGDVCVMTCAAERDTCEGRADYIACQARLEQCDNDCEPGPGCEEGCDADYSLCLAQSPGACAARYEEECRELCDPDEDPGCDVECELEFDGCLVLHCGNEFATCAQECAGDGGGGGDSGEGDVDGACAAVAPSPA